MATVLRVFGWIGAGLALLLLVLVGTAYVLLQTQPGHDFALRTALNQLPRYIDGDVVVDGLRSDGLLRGVTLHGVAIRDPEGRPFLEADSIRVQYSLREIMRRELVFVPADIWRPRITIETLHGDTRSNLERIFVGDREEPGDGPGFSISLRRAAVHDGDLVVRLPADADELPDRGITEVLTRDGQPDGAAEHYRLFRFSDLDMRIAEADLLDPEGEGERVEFQSLSLTGHILDEPFRIDELVGTLTRRGSQVAIESERIRLPGSELAGRATFDWQSLEVDVELDAPTLRLADLRWIDERVPDGEGSLSLRGVGPLEASQWRVTSADVQIGESRVVGDFGVDLEDGPRLADTSVELLPFALSELDPWLDEPLPIDGRVRGRLSASGLPSALAVQGSLSYEEPERELASSTAEFDGILHLGESPEVSEFSLVIDPLDFATLELLAPDLPLSGEGRLHVEASGGLASGVNLTAELEHRIAGAEGVFSSRIVAVGSVSSTGGEEPELQLALSATLSPLSLDGLALGLDRELPVAGALSGPVRVDGVLADLGLVGRLETPAGILEAEARIDARDPAAGYRVSGVLEEFRLHQLVEALPEPTVLNGSFLLDGSGLEFEELAGELRLGLGGSRLGGAEVERLDTHLTAVGGRLSIEELELASSFLVLSGSGDLALRDGEPEGEVFLVWEAESLSEIRPIYLGEEPIAADTLTDLEREILRMDGIDPDTLGTEEEIVLEGRAFGEVTLRGGVNDLGVDGFSELVDASFGAIAATRARVDFLGRWGGREDWEASGSFDVGDFRIGEFDFAAADGEIEYVPGAGAVHLDVRRSEGEGFRLQSAFSHDSVRVELDLESLALDFDDAEWRLDAPARIAATRSSVEVDRLRLVRPSGTATEEIRFEAGGVLDLDGDSDFTMEVAGMELQRLGQILQADQLPEGTLALDVSVRGPAGAPRMEGSFHVLDFASNGAHLSRVEGSLEYADQLVVTNMFAELDGQPLLSLEGRVPANLAFERVDDRFPDRNVDLTLVVDSLPAATALAFLEALEEVEGSLDGTVQLRGTPRELRPSGELRLRGGALSLPELGVFTSGISADMRLREDRVVEVEGAARARGTAQVSGTISLEEPTDPVFDLSISASGFQAVERRDLTSRVGGEVTLTGSFTAPRVGGTVRVEQGSIFLEEIARTAEVIDLTDPAFFDVVDTTLVAVRPVVEAAQNPFIQNLRVDVDLDIQRDFWLRSREMDVEMGGELIVTFDRPARELLLLGTLEATRGAYTAFGRQFQVVEGTVEFVGTPGINPSLSIEAVNRLRREGGEPLNIIAQVEGTLISPEVRLSTDAQPPIAESDLISYLIFGRPSYALASGETSVLQGAAGAGVSVGIGTLATQLGSVVAQQFGVDYFLITQSQEGGGLQTDSGFGGTFADTQIEVGQYVGQDLFLALVLRPLTGLGTRSQTQLPGARLEWRFTDTWTMEGFVEDRFAREGVSGFGELGIRLSKVVGLSIFREWGY